MPRVACIGEAMVEVALDPPPATTAQIGFAGDTLNTAIYLKRAAGSAVDVAYVTRLGRDGFSERMLGFIAGEGIVTDRIERDPDRVVGLYAISTDAAGERSFAYWRSVSAARRLFQAEGVLDFAALEGADLYFLSAITLAILPDEARNGLLDWLARARERGAQVAFDSNFRPALWGSAETARSWIAAAWAITDIALPSLDDEMAIFSDRDAAAVLARLRALGLREGALKRGATGPLSLDGEEYGPFPPAAAVVDTTAAGDSFNGGYLAARIAGADQAAALAAGHALAARVVGAKGAIVPRDAV